MSDTERLEEIRAHVEDMRRSFAGHFDIIVGDFGMLRDLLGMYDEQQITSDATTAAALLASNEACVLFSKRAEAAELDARNMRLMSESWESLAIKRYDDACATECDLRDKLEAAEHERDQLRAEVYQLRVQLAGCSCATLGSGDAAKQGDYGWSPAYQDVLILREEHDNLRAEVERLQEYIPRSGTQI